MTKEQLMEQEQAFIQDQQNLWEQWEKDHSPDETFIDRCLSPLGESGLK